MKVIYESDLPIELEGFAGGMGFMSIQSLSAMDLGLCDNCDITGYISENVDELFYAEVIDSWGNCMYACGEIDELQKWVTDTIYWFCTDTEN